MERFDRLLDVAADLLVRRGYQRVTIDDVAREAGVGKGTVYLHVRTKEALFVTVLLRAHRGVVGGLIERMETDPDSVLPSRMMRGVYLALAGDPVTRALYLGDPEVFGRLAHEASETLVEMGERRDAALREHLALLRDAGCLQTTHTIEEQHHLIVAVSAGFYLADPLVEAVSPPQRRADLLQHAAAAALEVPHPPPGATASVAPVVAATYRSLLEHVDEEWRARVR